MTAIEASRYPAAQAHEPIREIAPDVFFVPGTMQMAPLMRISRNMTVIRDGGDLTLVNAIRLTSAGEDALQRLGTVRHVMRLGCVHGLDDAYSVARFGAQFWCQAGSTRYPEPAPDHVLREGGPLPVGDAQLFVFRETRLPESALLLRRGGVLVTCDSLQHYGDWRRHSLAARLVMPLLGFSRTTLIGPPWKKHLTPPGGSLRADFERLASLEFDTLISAHGTPLVGGARGAVRAAIDRAYA
jgi:hypothetical protein